MHERHFDRATGLARAGGYSGHGVVASSLAGRTLAELITGTDSELTDLPWVGHASRRWEPEPLRLLGARTIAAVAASADAAEDRTGRPARRIALVRRWLPGAVTGARTPAKPDIGMASARGRGAAGSAG